MSIGQYLKCAREAKGLTQKALAKRAGVDERTIRRIEKSEEENYLWDTIDRLRRALEIKTFDELSTF